MMNIQRLSGPSSLSTKTPTAAEWAQHRALITDLYLGRKMTQRQVDFYMRRQHAFYASEKMYMTRFKEWGIKKKMSVEDAQAIVNATARRDDARRNVIRIRLRGREVTKEEARTSLKRRRLNNQASLHRVHRETTPSSVSIVSEDDEPFEETMEMDDEHVGRLVADAIVRQPPISPDLVGDERLEVIFIQKMREWQQCSDVGDEPLLEKFFEYSEDLLVLLNLPDPASNRRTQWTLHQLDSVLAQAFAPCQYWLLPQLVFLATYLKALPTRLENLVRSISSTILRAARNAVGDATMHPLLVICSFLYNSKQEQQFSRLLSHCSKFAQISHGPGTWKHRLIHRARSDYLQCTGELQEAESLLSDLLGQLHLELTVGNDKVLLYKCELAYVQSQRGKFAPAEEQLWEVLEHCREASQQQGSATIEFSRQLAYAHYSALEIMVALSARKLEFTAAEYWARKTLSYSEQAFGTTSTITAIAVHNLVHCLTNQAKWVEAVALLWEWQDILNPPQLFTDIEQEGSDRDRR